MKFLNDNIRNCIYLIDLISNSNLGYHHLQGLSSDSINDTVKEAVMHEVRVHFRPEFLNRLDDIIIFTPLGRKRKYNILVYNIFFYKNLILNKFFNLPN